MTTTQWVITVVAGVLGGGLAGAALKEVIQNRRNRKQPVGYTMEVIDIVRKGVNFPKFAQLIVLQHPLGFGGQKPVDNLSLVRITVQNKGNQDYKEFLFGVSLEGGNKAVEVRFNGPDRYHSIKIKLDENIRLLDEKDVDEQEPTEPLKNVDFILEPFNRRDTYNVEIFFTYDGDRGNVTLGSPHPTTFVKMEGVRASLFSLMFWTATMLFSVVVNLILHYWKPIVQALRELLP
ncbi:MAG TPA: hypothetical protein VE135_25905 [Pyrinomonadaceae bacterium]|nr:hypothetical protein [Pyrinomonadaceae bacterium]